MARGAFLLTCAMPAVPPITAIYLAPFGMEEGTEASFPAHELGVVVGEAVRFSFFGSSVRREDQAAGEGAQPNAARRMRKLGTRLVITLTTIVARRA